MNLAGLVAAQIDIYKPDAVFVDVTGMGWGVYAIGPVDKPDDWDQPPTTGQRDSHLRIA